MKHLCGVPHPEGGPPPFFFCHPPFSASWPARGGASGARGPGGCSLCTAQEGAQRPGARWRCTAGCTASSVHRLGGPRIRIWSRRSAGRCRRFFSCQRPGRLHWREGTGGTGRTLRGGRGGGGGMVRGLRRRCGPHRRGGGPHSGVGVREGPRAYVRRRRAPSLPLCPPQGGGSN